MTIDTHNWTCHTAAPDINLLCAIKPMSMLPILALLTLKMTGNRDTPHTRLL